MSSLNKLTMRMDSIRMKTGLFGSFYVREGMRIIIANGLAQGMVVAATPILTRIYGPHDFATFEVFYAISGSLAIFFHGRYTLALMIPKDEESAVRIFQIVVIIICIYCVIGIVVMSLWGGLLWNVFGLEAGQTWAILIAPVASILAMRQMTTFYLGRKRAFKIVAKNRIQLSSMMVVLQMGGVIAALNAFMLTGGRIIADFITTMMMVWRIAPELFSIRFHLGRSLRLLYVFRRFPLYLTWPGVFSDIQLAVLILAYRYSPESVGYFAVAKLLLLAPSVLVAEAISTVFYRRVMDEVNDSGHGRRTTLKAFLGLSGAAVCIFGSLMLVAPYLGFVLGDQWNNVTHMLYPLLPIAFAQFAMGPLSKTLSALERQRELLGLKMITTIVGIVVLWLVSAEHSMLFSLWVFGLVLFLGYSVILYACLTLSKASGSCNEIKT